MLAEYAGLVPNDQMIQIITHTKVSYLIHNYQVSDNR